MVEGEFPGNCSVSYLSFVYCSTGGVCGRSLTAGKILFIGRQTCSLYFVLITYNSVVYTNIKTDITIIKSTNRLLKRFIYIYLIYVVHIGI